MDEMVLSYLNKSLMKKSNIILFTDSYYPFKDSTSKINTQIVNYLSQFNQVTVVCAKDIFSEIPNSENISENIFIRRLSVPFVTSKLIPLKILKFISFSILICLCIVGMLLI